MIDLYTWTTPNGRKVSIALEEMGLAYAVHPIDITAGAQFSPDFLKISPNNKIPAIIDRMSGASAFESGAILVYLAERSGLFLPPGGPARAKVLEWLFWQVGGYGPMLGQLGHFVRAAPEKVPYAIDRFTTEARRLFGVLDRHLEGSQFLGGAYSIADMAVYPWTPYALASLKAASPDFAAPNVERWAAEVGARPAVKRGMAIPEIAT